ncbi:transmembrane protein 132C-like [Myxocyprinus asiaticus]|uniref:transmembrane protein 132C-like n=1 Tax=Myxocyprinus asiaticus TaxID=70543 RepID=UPI002221F878|nr:transmembrane protein 132C-like [Myxocyprinus asiaticus]
MWWYWSSAPEGGGARCCPPGDEGAAVIRQGVEELLPVARGRRSHYCPPGGRGARRHPLGGGAAADVCREVEELAAIHQEADFVLCVKDQLKQSLCADPDWICWFDAGLAGGPAIAMLLKLAVQVIENRMLREGLQRFGTIPMYLPVQYQVLNAESAFFLKEANQDIMRNSSLQARTEIFFIQQARKTPSVNASYGPLSVDQPVPVDLLSPGLFNNNPTSTSSSSSSSSSPLFTLNWKVQTFIISERIHPSWPKVQVLFYVVGRDWDDYSAVDRLPCVKMFAFHETQEVRGSCRLKGELGLCVAELEPLPGWFSPPSIIPGRQKLPEQVEGTPVELYYMVQSTDTGECSSEDSRKTNSIRNGQLGPAGYFSGPTPMRRIGSVRLFQPLSELRLDSNFVVMVPSRPIRQREMVSAFLAVSTLSSVEIFTLRVKLKDGVAFLGARASNPVQWTISQDVRSEGHRVVTLHCHRKEANFGKRVEAGFQKVLQVDLEVNGLLDPLGSRSVTWQIEYPISRTLSEEIQTLFRLAPHDLGGIVPLAMETEILNTAVLTGKTVAMPVKVVTVGTEGTVTDLTESVECRSTDEDVVKVSERCDYVYVNGKETRGRVRMMVNFTYSYLSAQLELSVWMPRLPLQIEMSDPELSQIRGWRVPADAANQRLGTGEDDEDEGARKDRGCVPQYQSTTVRVLTHFEAEPEEWQGQPDFLLGSDWQVDVTELVRDSLRVGNEQVARLSKEQVLIGLSTGTTNVQVMSPLSDSVLAERMIQVLDDKVSITELGVQLVSGLSLNLQLSPGSNRAIVATATTQETMHNTNQESLVSAWLQFSDGSMTPLDLYNPAHFVLTATSLDDQVVSVKKDATWMWPVVVAKGEGQGMLVRVEMFGLESCLKTKRLTVLAAGNANVHVKFGRGEETGNSASDRRYRPNAPYYGGSISDMEAGIINRGATTIKTAIPGKPSGDRLSVGDIPVDFSEFPAQADLPPGRNTEEDHLQTRRGLTDLEIGMYALLGVFCLAILVFLINCVSYAFKYSNKQLPLEGQETMAHAHDWVWLGHDAELLESQAGLCLDQEELGGTMDSGLGLEEGSQLLNGLSTQKSVQGQVHRSASDSGCAGRDHRSESLNSPTTKRKRVKFTTFSHSKPSNGCPSISPLLIGQNDIKWVCPDIELGDSNELRNYMERLNENATKNTA